jgi:sterol desaturase/sphingolipid hydroxylase (fatty acid hydroxylase superfamily)
MLMIAGSLALELGLLFGIVGLFVVVVPFEKLFPRHRGQKVRRPELGMDLGYAAISPVLNVVSITLAVIVGLVSLAWLPGLVLRPIVTALPGWLSAVLGIALFDVAIYWVHRWMHEVPMLWKFHAVHHSSATMDWVSGFRNHPVDGLIIAPAVFLLVAAGFSAQLTGALAIVQIVTGLFLHANVRWRWRPLQRLVITPEFHHWHHTNERTSWHTNYSVFLPVWDIIFGTYHVPGDRRPECYGVDDEVGDTIVAQLVTPLRGGSGLRTIARHPWQATRRGARWVRRLVGEIRTSTFRPTRVQRCG